jgi:hypothetical protein
VDTLLGLIRIKLAAARLHLPKVHVGREMLRVYFPPESATAFYEAPEFQQMMTVIGKMNDAGVRLQQSTDQLHAVFPLGAEKSDEQLIARALEYLGEIAHDSQG